MSDKISIVTVVYNAVSSIEKTIQSVLSQNYQNIEYIVIDGGSTDGTVDVIRRYSDRISYWISERDGGIYDAMNKGLQKSTGEWVNFMNSGDEFSSEKILNLIFGSDRKYEGVDVIYGNCKAVSDNEVIGRYAGADVDRLQKEFFYRHNASFVRTKLHRQNMFDLARASCYGYVLDYACHYALYLQGRKFHFINEFVVNYALEGVSNHNILTKIYDRRVVCGGSLGIKDRVGLAFDIVREWMKKAFVFRYGYLMWASACVFMGKMSMHRKKREFFYSLSGVRMGNDVVLSSGISIDFPVKLQIGSHVKIGRDCRIVCQEPVNIGDRVKIGDGVRILTMHSGHGGTIRKMSVSIGDGVVIGNNAIIYPGTRIPENVSVSDGAVVGENNL